MQLTNCAFFQMLLRGCNVMALWQILDHLLSNPTARKDLGLGIGEAPLQIGYGARVGALLSEVGRVGQINLVICSTCATSSKKCFDALVKHT